MPRRSSASKISAQATTGHPKDRITIRGARVHNLKNIDLDLPRNKLIVLTGVSGSGKSSLAFDTIYAEGQRRYVESLSSYARQFLERMDKPDVDLIQGISPAMAIEQRTNTRNPRSTVGTSTEIYDYLRLLFARVGKTFCRNCGKQVSRDSVRTVREAVTEILENGPDTIKTFIAFPPPSHGGETIATMVENIKKEGFFRILLGDRVIDLTQESFPKKVKRTEILVLVDRLIVRKGEKDDRFADSVETAFASGGGKATLVLPELQRRLEFNQNFECATCGIAYEEPDPRLFSFNSPFGACPECQGFGRAVGVDMGLVIPDRSKTLRQGAIHPWTTPKFRKYLAELIQLAEQSGTAGMRIDVPVAALNAEEMRRLKEGFGKFEGIDGFFKMLERKTYKIYYRVLLSRYRGYTTCPACGGARLRQDALNVRIAGKSIADLVRMTITSACEFAGSLQLTPFEHDIARRILDELKKRLGVLNRVGIGYLSLDRLSSTLSGGESQRINLATSLGSSLIGALYVLDEPSIGLHPRDNQKLISVLQALRDVGNTVLVVEHDGEMMRASDLLVDLGPRAGEHGGEVVFAGTPEEIVSHPDSLTGAYLSERMKIDLPPVRRPVDGDALVIRGAAEHNLKNIDVRIPLHALVCITGVSGSGKSTLVHDILYAGLKQLKGESTEKPGGFRSIQGHEHVNAVELVDQSPIGRSPRSNPVTYIQLFDQIRNLLASTQASRIHGYKPGHFSFNVPGGRCDACEGDGVVKVEMQFLADLFLPCDVCKGKRYKQEVLEVRYRGKNIDDILTMTVTEAIRFFEASAGSVKLAQKLKVLDDVGLGYIHLGQAATSLSGGEAQRIKLASHLTSTRDDQHTLFIFDEPTTGLHFDDIAKLMRCFHALINAGSSVVIIEHNLDVIKCADYIIDLGPEAGDGGGEVVAEGTPEQVCRSPHSHTGKFLKSYLVR